MTFCAIQWHRLTDDNSFNDDHSDSWSFAPAEGHSVKYPITVRPGSYNMDGYMDLVMTLRRRKYVEITILSIISLLENIAKFISLTSILFSWSCSFFNSLFSYTINVYITGSPRVFKVFKSL